MVELEEKSRKLLEQPNFCVVATLREDGRPLLVPVWVDVEDGKVVLNTAEGRAWPRNARRDPRVTLLIQNRENPYEYVTIRGRVVEDTHEGADEHIDAMAMKYLSRETYPFRAPGEQRVILRIEPEHVHHYGA